MFRTHTTDTTHRPTTRRTLGSLLLFSLLAAGVAFAGDTPSIRHTVFMRGHIIEVQDAKIVVCIGEAGGASVGQELDVVHHSRVTTSPKGASRFKREVTGKVRIDAIVDEHYAEATLIEGKADRSDSVDLFEAAK